MSYAFCNSLNKFMSAALNEAKKAESKDQIPIGAVIEFNGKIIARAHNGAFWHAEILCLQKAEKKLGKFNNEKLTNICATMYVTVEPCTMCMHAIKLARISKVIFGAYNKNEPLPEPEIIGGVQEIACKKLMQQFFKQKR